MKALLLSTTVTLVSTTVTLALASLASAAYADHPFNPGPFTTRGAYVEQWTKYLREHNNGAQQSTSSSSQQTSYDTSVLLKQSTNMNGSKDCQYVAPGGTTGGAIRQQLEAMAKCRSGS